MLRLPGVLDGLMVADCRRVLEAAAWVDGAVTAGAQSARAKANLQVPEDAPAIKPLQDLILGRLGRDPAFLSAALPLKVFPPLFNRYDQGMGFRAHIDNAVRFGGPDGRARYRTDLSCTLFLSDPGDYDGGELIVQDLFGEQSVKLNAGDMVLYPASSVHRVEPITRGSRWASFFWVQSMIRDDGQRALLHDLDRSIAEARAALGDDSETAVRLTGAYHNLLRMWSEA